MKIVIKAACLAALAATVLALAACGGSESSSSGGGTGGGETGGGSENSEVAELFKEFQTAKGLEGLPKIKKPVPSGKTIDFVSCAPAACLEEPHAFQRAAEVLGWNVKLINGGASPESFQTGMQQTVTDQPDAVLFNGLPTELITKQLAALKAAGIPAISVQNLAESEPPNLYEIPGETHYEAIGEAAVAAAVTAGGPEAEIGLLTVSAFPTYTVGIDPQIKKSLARLCPGCKLELFDVPVASIGKDAPSLITNFLESHRGIKTVINDQDANSLGLQAALKAAGIEDVKIVGVYSTAVNMPNVTDGQEFAILPFAAQEIAWIGADLLARTFAGESPEPDLQTTAPVVIWDEENMPPESGSTLPPIKEGYEEQFEQIWGK